jgi:hypothetical protein
MVRNAKSETPDQSRDLICPGSQTPEQILAEAERYGAYFHFVMEDGQGKLTWDFPPHDCRRDLDLCRRLRAIEHALCQNAAAIALLLTHRQFGGGTC